MSPTGRRPGPVNEDTPKREVYRMMGSESESTPPHNMDVGGSQESGNAGGERAGQHGDGLSTTVEASGERVRSARAVRTDESLYMSVARERGTVQSPWSRSSSASEKAQQQTLKSGYAIAVGVPMNGNGDRRLIRLIDPADAKEKALMIDERHGEAVIPAKGLIRAGILDPGTRYEIYAVEGEEHLYLLDPVETERATERGDDDARMSTVVQWDDERFHEPTVTHVDGRHVVGFIYFSRDCERARFSKEFREAMDMEGSTMIRLMEPAAPKHGRDDVPEHLTRDPAVLWIMIGALHEGNTMFGDSGSGSYATKRQSEHVDIEDQSRYTIGRIVEWKEAKQCKRGPREGEEGIIVEVVLERYADEYHRHWVDEHPKEGEKEGKGSSTREERVQVFRDVTESIGKAMLFDHLPPDVQKDINMRAYRELCHSCREKLRHGRSRDAADAFEAIREQMAREWHQGQV